LGQKEGEKAASRKTFRPQRMDQKFVLIGTKKEKRKQAEGGPAGDQFGKREVTKTASKGEGGLNQGRKNTSLSSPIHKLKTGGRQRKTSSKDDWASGNHL